MLQMLQPNDVAEQELLPMPDFSEAPPLTEMVDQLKKGRDEQRRHVGAWQIASRYLAGDQNITFNPNIGGIVPTLAPPGKHTLVFNFTRVLYRAKVSQLSVVYPDMAVRPMAPTEKEISEAIATEQIERAIWDQKQIVRVINTFIGYLCEWGTAALHTYWDSVKNDFATESKGPLDIIAEAGAINESETSWIAIRRIEKAKTVREAYPHYKGPLSEMSEASRNDRIRGLAGAGQLVPVNSVEIFDVYFKDGRHVVMTEDQYLWTGRTPKDVVPVQIGRYQTLSDRFYGAGLVQGLVDMQQNLNRTINRTLDMVEAGSNFIWMNPVGSGVNKHSLSNVVGQILNYNPAGGMPTRVNGSPVPPHMFEMIRQLMSLMQDYAELHNQSLGKRASGVNSGVAIEQLTQQDQAQTAITMNQIRDAVADMCRVHLAFAQETWTENRTIQVFDTYGGVIHKLVSAESIVKDPQFEIEANSLFHSSIGDQQQELQRWVQIGAITPQDALQRSRMRNFDKDRMKQMAASYKAKALVDAVLNGLPVILTASDPIASVKAQLEEIVYTPEFWQPYLDALQAWRQAGENPALAGAVDEQAHKIQFVNDFLASVSLPPEVPAQQVSAIAQQPIYPRAPGNPAPQQGPMDPASLDKRNQTLQDSDSREQNLVGSAGTMG